MKLHAELIGESPATKSPCGRNISACSTVRVEIGNGASDWETWDVQGFVTNDNACKTCVAALRRMSKDSNKRQTVTVTHNGFHGRTTLRFRPVAIETHTDDEGWSYMLCTVSERTARRLNDAVCGHETCKCGEKIAEAVWEPPYNRPAGYRVVVPADGSEVRGHYPQQ